MTSSSMVESENDVKYEKYPEWFKERKDFKLDFFAAELCKEKKYDFGGIFK